MKANLDLINARKSENETAIRKAIFMEEMDQDGITPEDLKNDAKKLLGLGEDGIVRLEWENIVKAQNKKIFAFIQVTNQLTFLEESGVLEASKVQEIRESVKALTQEVAGILNVDVEDLFEEVDEDFFKEGV